MAWHSIHQVLTVHKVDVMTPLLNFILKEAFWNYSIHIPKIPHVNLN